MFELRYQGETIGWATLSHQGCVLEAANDDMDAIKIQHLRGVVEWLIQGQRWAA